VVTRVETPGGERWNV